jgi:hypothetical protein
MNKKYELVADETISFVKFVEQLEVLEVE